MLLGTEHASEAKDLVSCSTFDSWATPIGSVQVRAHRIEGRHEG